MDEEFHCYPKLITLETSQKQFILIFGLLVESSTQVDLNEFDRFIVEWFNSAFEVFGK